MEHCVDIKMLTFTEFEDEIAFDLDDPDFATSSTNNKASANSRNSKNSCAVEARVSTPMSAKHYGDVAHTEDVSELLTRSHGNLDGLNDLRRNSSFGSSSSLSSSVDDFHHQAVLTIEELRIQLNTCFTCGVSWQDDHVSLDCAECGGYSLLRPCPSCDGRCSRMWQRDLPLSHTCGKARWLGQCAMDQVQTEMQVSAPPPPPPPLPPYLLSTQ